MKARYPGEGGLYVWFQQNLGAFAGFISAWAYWVCNVAFLPLVLYFIAGAYDDLPTYCQL